MTVMHCPTCDFFTDKPGRYRDHVKMHKNIRDMPCSLCGKLFVTNKTLRQHINRVHYRSHIKSESNQLVTEVQGFTNCSAVSLGHLCNGAADGTLTENFNSTMNEVHHHSADLSRLNGQCYNTKSVVMPRVIGDSGLTVTSSVIGNTVHEYDNMSAVTATAVVCNSASDDLVTAPIEYQMLMPVAASGLPSSSPSGGG